MFIGRLCSNNIFIWRSLRMKQNAMKQIQRILAVFCALAMVITLLPLHSVKADDYFYYNLHEKIKEGTIARPGQLIKAECETQDIDSSCTMNFYFEGKNVATVMSYFVSDGETIPAWEGVDYWEATDSQIEQVQSNDNFGNAFMIYNGTVNFTAVPLQDNNNGYYNDNTVRAIDDTPNEDQFYDYYEDVIRMNALIDFGQYEVTNELSDNNGVQENPRWAQGNPQQDVVYVATQVDTDITATPIPEDEKPRGPVNPDGTPEPTPWQDPRGPVNPDDTPTPEPSATPVPTSVEPTNPVITATPTPIPIPKEVTPIPTPEPQQVYIPPVPTGTVEVIAQVKEPQHVVYDIGIEVGRNAKITTGNKTNSSKKSSNKKIIHDPYEDVSTFATNKFIALASWPGDATLTFTGSEAIEDWNVHVYCRPLDFEQSQYVVVKPKKDYGYITLYLKYFEYASEFAYDFQWSSSNKDVAIVYGGDPNSTFCRFRVAKEGVTVISCKDKYGNESKTVLIVKPDESTSSGKDDNTGKDNSGKENTGKDNNTETKTLTTKQIKKNLKSASVELDCETKSDGSILFWWSGDDVGVPYNGYIIKYAEYKKGTSLDKLKYKTLKKINKGKKVKYTYSGSKLKKGKTYVFYVTGYVTIKDKKYYNTVHSEDYLKFKIKK